MSLKRTHSFTVLTFPDTPERVEAQRTSCGMRMFEIGKDGIAVDVVTPAIPLSVPWPDGVAKCKRCRDAEKAAARPADARRQKGGLTPQQRANLLLTRLWKKTPKHLRPAVDDFAGQKRMVLRYARSKVADALELARLCHWEIEEKPALVGEGEPAVPESLREVIRRGDNA